VPFAVLSLGLILPLGPARGQSLSERIREVASTASGFTLREELEEGALQAGRRMTFPADLQEGADVLVVGFCDSSCSDLDLSILDPSGTEIGNDRLPDAQPVLILTPKVEGTHQIQVEMVSCSLEPCRFAVGIMERGPGEGGSGGEGMADRLNRFRSELLQEGFMEVGSPETGSLDQDQEIRFPVSLTAGLEYRVAGVCDNDCEDMDLALYDPSGDEVVSDILVNPLPLLSLAPAATGEYRLAVLLVSCSIEPCEFLVSTFVKGENVGPGGAPITGTLVLLETHQGTLEAGDEITEDGKATDRYTVRAEAGQTILADLRSPDFDTYLILDGPETRLEENDDWGDDTMHSHIEVVAPTTGLYSILVTTFLAEEMGEYTLQIAVVEGS